MSKFVNFVCGQIMYFQAPVRNKKTAEWIKAYMEEMRAAGKDGFVPLLPNFLEWVFSRVDETTKDIANSHIEMLRPKLKASGKDYERSAFGARLKEGKMKLTNTTIFIKDGLAYCLKEGLDGVDGGILMKCAKREPMGFVMFLSASFVSAS